MTKSHFQEYQNRPIKEQRYYWYGPVVKLHIDDENKLHYSNISTDHSFSFDYDAPALSRTDDLSLLRRLPLTLGFNTKVKVFLSGLAGFKDLEIVVDDTKHSVETQAGVFDCFKITLSIRDEGSQITKNEVWISDSPERYPVKLKWSKLSSKLTQISDENYQTTIKTEATKLTMPLPKAWAGFDVTKRPDKGNSYAIRSPDGLTEAVLFHELKPDDYWQDFDIYKIKDDIVEWNNKIYAEYVVRPNSYEERTISGFNSLRFKADYLSSSKKEYVSDRMIIAKEPYLIKILTRQLAKNEALYQEERDAIFNAIHFE